MHVTSHGKINQHKKIIDKVPPALAKSKFWLHQHFESAMGLSKLVKFNFTAEKVC